MIIRVHSLFVLFFAVAFTLADETSKTLPGGVQPMPSTTLGTTPSNDTTPLSSTTTLAPNATTHTPPTTTPTTTHTPPTTTPTPPTTTHTPTPTTPTTTPTPTTTTTTPTPTPTPTTTTPTPTPTPTTTTPIPSTTPAPSPATEWVVKDNNTVCIIANMNMKITLPYMTKDNKTVIAEFDMKNTHNAIASGTCGEHNQTLVLKWHKSNITSSFIFDHKNKSDSYSLSSIAFILPVNDYNFKNSSMNATAIHLSLASEVFALPLNHSYTCASVNALNLNGTALNGTSPVSNTTINATLNLSNVHVQAFGKTNTTTYGAPKDCNHETPDIVPIAVGLILAGLVIVVLVAYLVGRRRALARGYLSM